MLAVATVVWSAEAAARYDAASPGQVVVYAKPS
jgi:hypothetical protein